MVVSSVSFFKPVVISTPKFMYILKEIEKTIIYKSKYKNLTKYFVMNSRILWTSKIRSPCVTIVVFKVG